MALRTFHSNPALGGFGGGSVVATEQDPIAYVAATSSTE
jgi:hypothetical protein